MHQRARSNQSGFTLVELMVVVAMIAVLSAIMFGVGSNTQGGNAQNVSEQTVSALNMARTRAVNTRRIHRVEVKANELLVWASTTTGFATPSAWAFVQRYKVPQNVTVYGAESTIRTSTGNTPSSGMNLTYNMDYKPDGSATGGTLYVTDTQNSASRRYRVLVYRATGSAYARQTW